MSVSFQNQYRERLSGIIQNESAKQAVILCHGFVSTKIGFQLPKISDRLEQLGYCTLRFDFSGNGNSEGEFNYANYQKEVDDIKAARSFLLIQGKDVVGLLGHSRSASEVLIYTSQAQNIQTVISVAPRFYFKGGIKERFGDDIFEKVKQAPQQFSQSRDDGFKIDYKLTQENYYYVKEAYQNLFEKSEDLDQRLSIDMASICKNINNTSVLIIYGVRDTTIPVSEADEYQKNIQNSKVLKVQNGDHNFTQPEAQTELIDAIAKFLPSINPIYQ